MPRSCTICISGKAELVDSDLSSGVKNSILLRRRNITASQLRAHLPHADIRVEFEADTEPLATPEIEPQPATPAPLIKKENLDALSELLAQRERLLSDIQLSLSEGRRDHSLKSENALRQNLELEAKLKAEAKESISDAQIQNAVRLHTASLTRFLIKTLQPYPDALESLQQALKSEYGL